MMRALLRSFSLDYVSRLLQFALRQHPFLVANVLLALLSVLLELAAIASLLPLSTIAAGGELGADSIWRKAFALVGVEVSFAGLVLYFVFLFATRLLSNFVNQTTSIFIGKRVQAELSSRAFQKLVKEMSLRDIDSRSAGHFISLAGDETARAGAILISLNQALAALLLASVYLAAIFLFSAWLGLGITAFVAIALLSLRGTLRRSQALSSRQLGEAKVAHSVFLDALNGLRSVRALSAEDFVTSRYDGIIKQYTRTHFHIDTLAFAARLIPALILLCCVAFAAAGGYLMVASPAGLAAILTGLALLLRFVPAAGQVLTLSMRLLADLRAASDVTHLLDAPTASAAHAKRKLERSIEVLELRQVSFAYKAARPVLRGFSAQFRRGHVYALVGPSGSGKTTVLDLLLGFYPPDAGEVLVNGISADAVEPASLRARVILVGQQVTILNDSIANNIRFGRPASDDEVKRACAAACIHDYIAAQPQGYETLLSYQGSNLSGGQRQRIAIARALLREPDILLLDESTSGLDAETRDRVVGNIIDLYRPRIVIFATHDPALIQGVDQVVSLEQTAESLGPASVAAAATRPK